MSTYALQIQGPVPQAGRYLALPQSGFALLVSTEHPNQAIRFRSKTTAQRYRTRILAVVADKAMTLTVKKVKL